jgi:hypothetical protein
MKSSAVKRILKDTSRASTQTATVKSVELDRVSIQIGSSPNVIKNVKVTGGTKNILVEDTVNIIWVDRRPVVVNGTLDAGNISFNVTSTSSGTGGSSVLSGMDDVLISGPANRDALIYDTSLSKWKNDVMDHGDLSGRSDDDHSIYLTNGRHDTTTRHALGTVVPHDAHSALSGSTTGDDHTQYMLASGTRHDLTARHTLGTVVPHDVHSGLSGLTTGDDHTQYVHVSTDKTITANHTFSPASSRTPFTLGANAIGQLVSGLNSDTTDGVHLSGSGNTLTVPTSGIAALLAVSNTFSSSNTFNGQLNTQSIIPNATDTYDLGSSTKLWRKGWLSELEAILFAKNTISVVGGWMYIAKGEGSLGPDINNTQTTIDFGQTMTPGHWVIFRTSLQTEYMLIGTNTTSPLNTGTTYNVSRNVNGDGANTWPAGSVYVILGASGDGRIELNASDTPRISMIKQGATYGAQNEYVRIGDLNGMPSYTTEKWGMFIGDAANYLKYDISSATLTIAGNGSNITSINGGNITTNTIAADRLTATTLSSIRADMGTITAGSIVIGTTNKLWLNDAADGALNIGGTVKASAPFRVSSAGALTATGASVSGAITATSGTISGTMNVTGAITAGAGSVKIDTDGINLIVSSSYATPSSIKYLNSSLAKIWADYVYYNSASDTVFRYSDNAGRSTANITRNENINATTRADYNLMLSGGGSNASIVATTFSGYSKIAIAAGQGTDIYGDLTARNKFVAYGSASVGSILGGGLTVAGTTTLYPGAGIPAITVSGSTAVCTGLNADQLDGYSAGNATGQIPISNGTANANLNADAVDGAHYSEGTWTPVPTGFTAPQTAIGTYVKIGKHVTATLSMPNNGISSSTALTVTGLPFTSANTPNHVWAGVCGYAIDNSVALTGAAKWQIVGGSTTAVFYTNMNNGIWTNGNIKRAYAVMTYEAA